MDFGEAEASFAELQRKLRQNAISQEVFNQGASKLMVQDEDGKYWAVDPADGRWLYHDGQSWTPAMPPTVHTQVNKIVPRRHDRWPLILGVSIAVLMCLLSILVVLAYRSLQKPGLVVPVGPSVTSPAQTVQVEPTFSLEPPSPKSPAGTLDASGAEVVPIVLPTGTPVCRYDASFVGDVNISDGQVVESGQRFNKIWRMRNTGTCPWVGFAWTYISGSHLDGPDSVGVRRTEPGDTVDINVPLYAETDPGAYTGIWRLRDPKGHEVGPSVRVSVVVVTAPTDTPAATTQTTAAPRDATPLVAFRAEDDSINASQCTKLRWDVENVEVVCPNDADVVGHDFREICRTESTIANSVECWAVQSIARSSL
jgi:hypothetical protein